MYKNFYIYFFLCQLLLYLIIPEYCESKCISLKNCSNAQNYLKLPAYNQTAQKLHKHDCIPIQQCPLANSIMQTYRKSQNFSVQKLPESFLLYLCVNENKTINCGEYSQNKLESSLAFDCGKTEYNRNKFQFRIANGNVAEENEYPWLALLEYDNENITCGGVMILQKYVLSAAHCVQSYEEKLISIRFDVKNKTDENSGVRYKIEKIYIHPEYNKDTIKSDLSIIRLSDVVRFKSNVCLKRSLSMKISSNSSLEITGFGKIDAFTNSEVKRKGIVHLSQLPIPYTNSNNNLYTTDKFFANSPETETDTCRGDSGGPIMYTDKSGTTYLIGITTVGHPQCGNGGLYTNVSVYLNWTLKTITADSLSVKTKSQKTINIDEYVVNNKSCMANAERYIKFKNLSPKTRALLKASTFIDSNRQKNLDCTTLSPFSDCIEIHKCPLAYIFMFINSLRQNKQESTTSKNFISSICGVERNRINCIEFYKMELLTTLNKNCGSNGDSAAFVSDKNVTQIYCNGVILSRRYILTSAQCIESNKLKIELVHLDNGSLKFYIERWLIHPGFNKNTLESDIALIRLQEIVQFNDWIRPICLKKNFTKNDLSHVALIQTSWKFQKQLQHIYLNDKVLTNFSNDTNEDFLMITSSTRTVLFGMKSHFPHISSYSGSRYVFYTNMSNYFDWILETIIADDKISKIKEGRIFN